MTQEDVCLLGDLPSSTGRNATAWTSRWVGVWWMGCALCWSRWRTWWFTTSIDREHTMEDLVVPVLRGGRRRPPCGRAPTGWGRLAGETQRGSTPRDPRAILYQRPRNLPTKCSRSPCGVPNGRSTPLPTGLQPTSRRRRSRSLFRSLRPGCGGRILGVRGRGLSGVAAWKACLGFGRRDWRQFVGRCDRLGPLPDLWWQAFLECGAGGT